MTPLDIDRLRKVDDFESLVVFLRDELGWPLEAEDIEQLYFDYEPEELGLSEEVAVKINFIKQLRPLAENQPWGIFYIDFEPKRLPVVVLRRVLQKLVIKKRPSSKKSNLPGWHSNDLLFINSFGETEDRNITFAHFKQENENQLPTLKVIAWDGQDTPLHLDRCANELGYLYFDPDMEAESWRENWSAAFTTTHKHTIGTSKKLVKRLAELAKIVRINAEHILKYETEGGRFKKAMGKFKTALIHDLTEEDFADMYAQTIAYGLLYTAIRSHVKGEGQTVSAEHVQQLVLPTNPFLKEVMEDFFNIGSRRWDSEQEKLTGIDFDELGINDIISTLKDERTDFDDILRDFGKRNPNEDPVIHFYELFLKEYDSLKRKSRGVYYTPQPVVSFIVRSIHELLQKDFGLEYGLADTTTWSQVIEKNPRIKIPKGVKEDDFFVQVLDPALGTGTFLVETIDVIHRTVEEAWAKHGLKKEEIQGRWNKYVPEKLLPRLYGFELMMAPYAIAHMKIGIKLFETGYENFEKDKKRVQVYLTNTLEEAVDASEYLKTLDPAMAEETRQANEIKNKNSITIIIGNPPYAGHSFNASKIRIHFKPGQSYQTWSKSKKGFITKKASSKGFTQEKYTWIGNLIQPYFFVDGAPLGEKNPKWLNDDYVKFIRYSQYRLEESGVGVFGFITNHSYIDNPTFRGMRQSLMNTYRNINIIDLHGSAKKKDKAPDGSKDENVFDIQQGVAINITSKSSNKNRSYSHAHLWGTREKKFSDCQSNSVCSLENVVELDPISDMYLFCPQEQNVREEFIAYPKITDVMPENVLGFQTHRDTFAIEGNLEVLKERFADFCGSEKPDRYFRDEFNLSESSNWRISEVRKKLRKDEYFPSKFQECLYRPFDCRYVFYHRTIVDRPRTQLMDHVVGKENLCLGIGRQGIAVNDPIWYLIAVSRIVVDANIFRRGGINLFYLYHYPTEGELDFAGGDWPPGPLGRTPNLQKEFVERLAAGVGLDFISDGLGDLEMTFGPEDILRYIYAVFHAPSYRTRYADFLKTDFPRVPITSDGGMFKVLCGFGNNLVALHLMESDKLNDFITTFPVSGDNSVTKVGETKKKLKDVKNDKGKLFINKTQYFDGLPEYVWNFHIGGYQVCHKWLADRKKAGRKLSAEDIEHYHKIVVAIDETIKIMKQIDETIDTHGGWPIK